MLSFPTEEPRLEQWVRQHLSKALLVSLARRSDQPDRISTSTRSHTRRKSTRLCSARTERSGPLREWMRRSKPSAPPGARPKRTTQDSSRESSAQKTISCVSSSRLGLTAGVWGRRRTAKGNTLLNYADVRADLPPFVVDMKPASQDEYLPGSRNSIVSAPRVAEKAPGLVACLGYVRE